MTTSPKIETRGSVRVSAWKKEVRKEKRPRLDYCDPNTLRVYRPGTDIRIGLTPKNKLKPRDKLVDVINNAHKKGMKEDDITFIVVAPVNDAFHTQVCA